MNDVSGGDLVQVAVPRQHLIAVYGLLAQLEQGTQARTDVPSSGETRGQEGAAVWSVVDLRRFAATPTATSATIGKVLDALVAHPGEYLSTSELEKQTGVARSNLKGAFSALTRHINKHYGGRDWMLTWVGGSELGAGHPTEMHYTLSEEQAARWREARATR